MSDNILFLVVDLFCGAGGTSSGFEGADISGQKIAKVIACINHDRNAINSHKANHPQAKHFTEDIKKFDPKKLTPIINKWLKKYPNAKVILWASLECTNFSNAKGGLPRDADSRTLAEHLYKYIRAFKYDSVMIENVVEFMSWGKLDDKGKPLSKDKGEDFVRWKNNINLYGYQDYWTTINAADHGATQSRKRLFGLFAGEGFPALFPDATHSKYPEKTGLKKWIGVRKDLDLNDEGQSIFSRKKPLVEATLRRIYAGLLKHVAGGMENFTITYYTGDDQYRNHSVDETIGTVTTANRHAIVKNHFISKYFSGGDMNKNKSIEEPVGAVTTVDHSALVTAFITKYYSGGGTNGSIDNPLGTLTTKDRAGIVKCDVFMDKNYGNGSTHSLDEVCGTLTTKDKMSMVKCFLVNGNSSTSPALNLESPAPTVTTGRTHLLVNPGWFGHNGSVDEPCCTIVARQDKAPISIVNAEHGEIIIPVYEDDSEYLVKIKEFMAAYGIVDIKMRMLNIKELLRIQGFDENYTLIGTQTEQKKYIGNAVHSKVPKRWIECIAQEVMKLQKKAA